MYLLYTISIDQKSGYPLADKGIQVGVLQRARKVFVKDEFWGKTEIVLEDNADFGYDPKKKGKYVLLPYVNSYKVEELEDGFKKFHFTVGKKFSSEFEGSILFIKSSPTKIETNGEILFGGTPKQIVVVLREEQYMEFGELRFEALDQDIFYFGYT